MSSKRMLNKMIVDTDQFLNMPISSQNLYFHLCVRADDEGFVGKFKAIMRMVQASEDDIKILIAKNLIIYFESGICVITHWFIHNDIRKDRATPTFYQQEKSRIVLKNDTYQLLTDVTTKCQPNVNQMSTKCQPNVNQMSA